MAHDLIFGKTKRNFSRKISASTKSAATPAPRAKDETPDFSSYLQKEVWKKPFPILLDHASASEANRSGKTIQGAPFILVLKKGIKEGKLKISKSGPRVFFLASAPFTIVASSPPTGAQIDQARLNNKRR